MSWNLTRKTPPEELAALNEETVHQRRIGTAVDAGVSVCGQTGVQCSTSVRGEGVTCAICLVEVNRWKAKRAAEEERRSNSKRAQLERQRQRHRERVKERGFVSVSHMLDPEIVSDLDLLIEAGLARSRRHAFVLALRFWIDEHPTELARAKVARHAREVALQTAVSALEFAGKTPGAPAPSRHTTELKERLLELERSLACDPDTDFPRTPK